MTTRNLEFLFRPRSVAVIGASSRPHSVGQAVMRNLLRGGFDGPVMPVNPRYEAVAGVLAYPDVESLPVTPDLAVICTPPAVVADTVARLGARGTRAAILLTAGLAAQRDDSGRSLLEATLAAARPNLMRLLGPNCLGLIAPHLGLDASFAPVSAAPGKVAFIHQSGALCTALLDWAATQGVGFSHFVSLGDAADVDFGDTLDFLGGDPSAAAVLLYIESIRDARKFMSAARAAARNKPVLVVKAGRVEEGARAAATHTGALAGADEVYDAAFRRAGMLRVFDTGELFDAVETLARAPDVRGDRLAILTNGGGPGVIATDALVLGGGQLAPLSAKTVAKLDTLLPATWSRSNPVDIVGDATGERYARAIEALIADEGIDNLLVLHSPTAVVSSVEAAEGVVRVIAEGTRRCAVFASWLGGATVQPAREVLTAAGIANYETPESAVRAFLHIVRYRRSQMLLRETPPSIPETFSPATHTVRTLIDSARAQERTMLSEPEAKTVLAAYGIPVVKTRIAHTPEEAGETAAKIGLPVALKVLSQDISHKSDVGGVVLDLATAPDVERAAREMNERIAALQPHARLDGFTVQAMARRPGAHELLLGIATDAVFGPVILFGEGGTGAEVIADKAIALPPLNMKLAHDLVARTRIARRLAGYRGRAPADVEAVCLTLCKLSQLLCDVGEIAELDINPLFADEHGVLALDARIRVRAPGEKPPALAIRPYPKGLEETILLGGETVLLRPIKPEDEPQHAVFLGGLAPEDIRFRFFGMVRDMPHSQLARFTQIDYDREMAFIASVLRDGQPQTVGVVRAISDPDNASAEFAIVVSSQLKGKGLGHALLEKMIRYCRERGTGELVGEVLADNERMLSLAATLGFDLQSLRAGTVGARLALR